jgi:hypothetical protein
MQADTDSTDTQQTYDWLTRGKVEYDKVINRRTLPHLSPNHCPCSSALQTNEGAAFCLEIKSKMVWDTKQSVDWLTRCKVEFDKVEEWGKGSLFNNILSVIPQIREYTAETESDDNDPHDADAKANNEETALVARNDNQYDYDGKHKGRQGKCTHLQGWTFTVSHP